jgi:hypothetical protein
MLYTARRGLEAFPGDWDGGSEMGNGYSFFPAGTPVHRGLLKSFASTESSWRAGQGTGRDACGLIFPRLTETKRRATYSVWQEAESIYYLG